MVSKREEFCANSFDQFLAKRLRIVERNWSPVPQGQDPPDFFLTLNRTTFAVEVTTTRVMREVAVGSGQIGEETYERSYTDFVGKVEEEANKLGVLDGTYVVHFLRPMAKSNFRRVREEVFQGLLDYIERTQSEIAAPEEIIRYDGYAVCSIQKHNDQVDIVAEAFSDAAWVESPEVTDSVCQMLEVAVAEKKQVFLRKGAEDPKVLSFPRILLLLNTYRFAEQTMYVNCAKRVTGLNFFHSVFVVQGDGAAFLLFTSDPDWARKAQNGGA
jgi:hypothetical protein